MPRHAALRPTLWDTLLAYVTLVVAYLRLTVANGRHTLRANTQRRGRAEFGADDQWAADLSSMKDSMATTAVMAISDEALAEIDAEVRFERTYMDAADNYVAWRGRS